MTTSLSTRLREETKQAHTRAERSGIMRALLTGQLSVEGYSGLLANLHTVYQALESALATHASQPAVAAIYDPALDRTARLAEDLTILAGKEWATTLRIVAPSAAYAERIATVAASEPALLVAHSYTRYLGDLSGGQILLRFVSRILPKEKEAAIAFYDFPAITDPDAYKKRYRDALDQIAVDAGGADRMVAEAIGAFELNAQLFEALA
jgi:heme oxygenase (biliverdin-producing, ferredoxin)